MKNLINYLNKYNYKTCLVEADDLPFSGER